MNKSAKILKIAVLSLISGLLFSCLAFFTFSTIEIPNVFAANNGRITIRNPLVWGTLQEIIEAILRVVFIISLILTPLFVMIGAFYIMTAGDSKDRMSTGKKFILYAVIGLIVIFFSRAIIGLIHGILGIERT